MEPRLRLLLFLNTHRKHWSATANKVFEVVPKAVLIALASEKTVSGFKFRFKIFALKQVDLYLFKF